MTELECIFKETHHTCFDIVAVTSFVRPASITRHRSNKWIWLDELSSFFSRCMLCRDDTSAWPSVSEGVSQTCPGKTATFQTSQSLILKEMMTWFLEGRVDWPAESTFVASTDTHTHEQTLVIITGLTHEGRYKVDHPVLSLYQHDPPAKHQTTPTSGPHPWLITDSTHILHTTALLIQTLPTYFHPSHFTADLDEEWEVEEVLHSVGKWIRVNQELKVVDMTPTLAGTLQSGEHVDHVSSRAFFLFFFKALQLHTAWQIA